MDIHLKKTATRCSHSNFITQLTSAIVNTDFDLVQHKVVSTVPQIGLYIVLFKYNFIADEGSLAPMSRQYNSII